ncbi:hypothetical protein [Szabonella alba]|uniref:Uncharacterized protein n=1 Tax=Szabonella alba TaxID=2804194 RepID=A0A8K0V7J3_9RHOB|nr:hypothetical protein [Szabonella alba]MBL4916586.1 hypothetical protein [Szabonella alba]
MTSPEPDRTKPDWTKLDWVPINRAHDTVVAALKRLEGTCLKEVASELHAPNLEMPIWILLYDAKDIGDAHQAVTAVLAPHYTTLGPMTCTLAYLVLTETEEIQVDFLEGRAEIEAAPEARPLGTRPMTGPRPESGMFETVTSSRR